MARWCLSAFKPLMLDSHIRFVSGTAPLIVLRRSTALRVAMAVFAFISSCSVYTAFEPRCGIAQALWFAASSVLLLMLGVLVYERRQPTVLKVGPDVIVMLDCAGEVLCSGRIVGFTQWTGLFLILAIADRERKGRSVPFLIPADSLFPDSFRELAVKARHHAR
jgi:hypothetical protein